MFEFRRLEFGEQPLEILLIALRLRLLRERIQRIAEDAALIADERGAERRLDAGCGLDGGQLRAIIGNDGGIRRARKPRTALRLPIDGAAERIQQLHDGACAALLTDVQPIQQRLRLARRLAALRPRNLLRWDGRELYEREREEEAAHQCTCRAAICAASCGNCFETCRLISGGITVHHHSMMMAASVSSCSARSSVCCAACSLRLASVRAIT